MVRLNDIIAYFSPRKALRRETYKRYYEAAAGGRTAKSFKHATPTGPNMDFGANRSTLLSRSRYLYKNNQRIQRAVNVIADNVVGGGIQPAPEGTKPQVKKIMKLWKAWAGEPVCDWNETTTFYGLQDLIMKEMTVAGECFVVKRRTDDPIPLRLQVILS